MCSSRCLFRIHGGMKSPSSPLLVAQGWVEDEVREANPWRTVQDTRFFTGNSGRWGFPGYNAILFSILIISKNEEKLRAWSICCSFDVWVRSYHFPTFSLDMSQHSKMNGKTKGWQGKNKHFGWLGPMHCTHHVWFDWEVFFVEERRIGKNPQWGKEKTRRGLGERQGQVKMY